jgi:hypothetical protein
MQTFKMTTFGVSNFTLTVRTMLFNMITVYNSENMKCSLHFVINHGKYRDSVSVIATRIRAGRSGVRVPAGVRGFTLLLNA